MKWGSGFSMLQITRLRSQAAPLQAAPACKWFHDKCIAVMKWGSGFSMLQKTRLRSQAAPLQAARTIMMCVAELLACMLQRTRLRSRAVSYVGLARTIYIRCIYGTFGREITKCTVIYGVYIRFWPTLVICHESFAAGSNCAVRQPRFKRQVCSCYVTFWCRKEVHPHPPTHPHAHTHMYTCNHKTTHTSP
jgi:hypothetical protein